MSDLDDVEDCPKGEIEPLSSISRVRPKKLSWSGWQTGRDEIDHPGNSPQVR